MRTSSPIGSFDAAASRFSSANSGDSSNDRRSQKLASPSSPPITNAMRQPYDAASAGVSTVPTINAIVVPSATPIVTHAKTTLQTNGAMGGADSTT